MRIGPRTQTIVSISIVLVSLLGIGSLACKNSPGKVSSTTPGLSQGTSTYLCVGGGFDPYNMVDGLSDKIGFADQEEFVPWGTVETYDVGDETVQWQHKVEWVDRHWSLPTSACVRVEGEAVKGVYAPGEVVVMAFLIKGGQEPDYLPIAKVVSISDQGITIKRAYYTE